MARDACASRSPFRHHFGSWRNVRNPCRVTSKPRSETASQDQARVVRPATKSGRTYISDDTMPRRERTKIERIFVWTIPFMDLRTLANHREQSREISVAELPTFSSSRRVGRRLNRPLVQPQSHRAVSDDSKKPRHAIENKKPGLRAGLLLDYQRR